MFVVLTGFYGKTKGFKEEDFSNTTIAFLTPNDASYVVTKLSVWLCNSTVVPLSPKYPAEELEYAIQQSCAKFIVSHPRFEEVRIINSFLFLS